MSEKNGRARSASSAAVSERALLEAVATSRLAEDRESGQHPVDVLVGEDRRDDDIARGRQARQHVAEAGEVVRAVQISRGSSLRRSSRPAAGPRTCPSTGRPRNASAAAIAIARLLWPATTTCSAPFSRASPSHSGSPTTTVAPGWTTASFSAAIASRVVPSTSVCSRRDVGQHLDRRAEDVRRVVAARRAPPRRRQRRPRPLRTRRGRRR